MLIPSFKQFYLQLVLPESTVPEVAEYQDIRWKTCPLCGKAATLSQPTPPPPKKGNYFFQTIFYKTEPTF